MKVGVADAGSGAKVKKCNEKYVFIRPVVVMHVRLRGLCWLGEGVKATQHQQVRIWGGTVKTRLVRLAESCKVPEVCFSTGHFAGRHGLTE